MFDLSLNIQPSDTAKKLAKLASDETLTDVNTVLAREQVSRLQTYHREFEAKGGWKNPALPTHGAGRTKSRFGEAISRAWESREADAESFSVVNTDPRFKHKVKGGTITAKRVRALTIPMVPEAHGVRAKDYPGKLFRPEGKDYLAEVKDERLRVVYLLRKSVTQAPWAGALPDMEMEKSHLAQRFAEVLLEEIE